MSKYLQLVLIVEEETYFTINNVYLGDSNTEEESTIAAYALDAINHLVDKVNRDKKVSLKKFGIGSIIKSHRPTICWSSVPFYNNELGFGPSSSKSYHEDFLRRHKVIKDLMDSSWPSYLITGVHVEEGKTSRGIAKRRVCLRTTNLATRKEAKILVLDLNEFDVGYWERLRLWCKDPSTLSDHFINAANSEGDYPFLYVEFVCGLHVVS